MMNTMFQKRKSRFCCKLAQVIHRAVGWNGQLLESGGQRSRSHDNEVRFPGWRWRSHLITRSLSTSTFARWH